ncbi:hypothetical protein F503_08351 [Ophiostoma piceae UAMH 11346]|uniref:J domain-containing protein n=1 Tax=Ophiostoma piceae (strain UAMH 11346) TaxID=1262450 RepID=S3CY58_OPHP1|nr:hypothetical protein F503_08351 [Ophiostoma piceae UAMH 11346]
MDHDGPLPDYYAILKVPSTATTKQIRDAYKRGALENHPDRVPLESPERKTRTRKFQLINDAYYTLSDKDRRKEYDIKWKIQQRRSGSSSNKNSYGFTDADEEEDDDTSDYPHPGAFPQDEADEGAGAGSGASWSWNPFSRGASDSGAGASSSRAHQTAEDAQFADAFEEMMRDEGMAEGDTSRPTHKFWSLVGGVSGGALGFIVANVPGMVAGAVAGNRLGAIRDDKGMSVYDVFQQLPQDDRSRMLGQLAARVLSHAAGI